MTATSTRSPGSPSFAPSARRIATGGGASETAGSVCTRDLCSTAGLPHGAPNLRGSGLFGRSLLARPLEAVEDAVDDLVEAPVAVLLVLGDIGGVLVRLSKKEAQEVRVDSRCLEAVAQVLQVACVEDLLVLVSHGHAEDGFAQVERLAD